MTQMLHIGNMLQSHFPLFMLAIFLPFLEAGKYSQKKGAFFKMEALSINSQFSMFHVKVRY